MKERGFTLLELLLGLMVSGILAHLAAPNFKGLLEAHQQRSAANSLADGLRFARNEALARNRDVVIHASEDDWSQGWRVIEDVSGRGHMDDDNPVLLERQDSGHITIVGNGPVKSLVRFSGLGEPIFTGGGFRAGTVHICGMDQAQSLYQVVLAPSGRISLRSDKTEQALCRG
jgi:type IV fimbrial biogenesis protein FimT